MAAFNEENFNGKGKKRQLAAFAGTVESIKTQFSGNCTVTLCHTKENGEARRRDVVFKGIEMTTHGLHGIMTPGRSIGVFGVVTKTRTLFPVCIVKYKEHGDFTVVELTSNHDQYLVALKQQEKSQQKGLLDYSGG